MKPSLVAVWGVVAVILTGTVSAQEFPTTPTRQAFTPASTPSSGVKSSPAATPAGVRPSPAATRPSPAPPPAAAAAQTPRPKPKATPVSRAAVADGDNTTKIVAIFRGPGHFSPELAAKYAVGASAADPSAQPGAAASPRPPDVDRSTAVATTSPSPVARPSSPATVLPPVSPAATARPKATPASRAPDSIPDAPLPTRSTDVEPSAAALLPPPPVDSSTPFATPAMRATPPPPPPSFQDRPGIPDAPSVTGSNSPDPAATPFGRPRGTSGKSETPLAPVDVLPQPSP